MAIIGKIREKSWLVLILVGGALVAFILGDWQNIFSGTDYEYGYGTVYGEKVDINAFENEVVEQQKMADLNAQAQGQQPQPINRDQLWTSFVEDILLEKEFEALGITVSDEELDAYLYAREGFSPLPDLAQNFKDSLGNFSPQMLQARISEMENSDDEQQQEMWKNYRESLINRRKQEKYRELLAQSVYITELQAKEEYLAKQEVKSISFVLQRYSTIDNSEIDDSDEKLKAYYEEHKNEEDYKIKEASREVKFIDFTLDPSAADSARHEEKIAKLKAGFQSAVNDSIFVMKNSERKFYVSQIGWRPAGDPKAKQGFTYPKYMDSIFKNASVGTVIGPYQDNGMTNLAKVIGKKEKLLTVRHILISADRNDEAAVSKAKKTTDSLMAIVNSENFEELVRKHSQDQGSLQTGGKYEDFVAGEMVPEFSNFASEEPIGKIGYVQTDYGFHIIEVLDRKPANIPNLALVSVTLKPSVDAIDEKEDEVYDLLFSMAAEMDKVQDPYKKVEKFDTLAHQANHFPRIMRIAEDKPVINGMNSVTAENAILKLAFSEETKVGTLVGSPIRDKDRLILAVVSGIKEEGVGSFEEMKEKIRMNYIKDEKAKILMAKMSKGKSLGDLEDQAKGVRIQQAEVTFSAPQIKGAGTDPKIIGAVFSGLKDGETTKPIKGQLGVYVIKIERTEKALEAANYENEKAQLTVSNENIVKNKAMEGLKERADVVDNRRFFEANIRR